MRLVSEDLQEIFDISYKYFKDARSACKTRTGMCVYENEVGQRCVAGNLMIAETPKDEDALRNYLGSAREIAQHVGLEVPVPTLNLLLSLQNVHDTMGNWVAWGMGRFDNFEAVKQVGRLYGLEVGDAAD